MITLAGIAVVAVVVFGVLWAVSAWRNGDGSATTVAAGSETGVDESTTTAPSDSTAAEPEATSSSAPATTTPPETTLSTIGVRDPSQISVQVLNSVGTTGLAGEVTIQLISAGYRTVEADDYEPLQDRSQVLFRDGYGPEAFELAAAFFPDAEVGMSPDIPADVDIMVLLGTSFEAG
jgi:cytoskeletal protein RodZ